MGKSLQDQLLSLGLVDEKKLRTAKQEKRKEEKQQKGGRAPAVDEARQKLQKEQAAKVERDRQLNRQRQEEAQRKALAAQIKQIIDASRLPKGDGEVAYNFLDGKKVRRLYVGPAVHGQLTRGAAFIAKLHGEYNIVPAEAAEKIRERDPSCILRQESKPAEEEMDEAYAKYQVPDDLMW